MKVYELLESPDRWTTKAFARDENGKNVLPTSEKAVRWCLEGAIIRCYDCTSTLILNKVYTYVMTKYKKPTFIFNDIMTHEEIIALAKELDI